MTLDFNSRAMYAESADRAVNAAIDAALDRKRKGQERRAYLGASAVGKACQRQVQFEFAGAPYEREPDGRILRIFDRGHVWEEVIRGWLHDAGFRIVQRNQRTRELFAFDQLDGRFRGHVDGVILEGPDIPGMGYPCLWENKAVGAKAYREIARDGLTKARPVYADQVAIYQAYVGPETDRLTKNPALFTVLNSDTCEMLAILVPFDAERAQRASDRAVQIVTATDAGELLPRPFADRTHFECKVCAFAERCWGLAA